MLAEGFTQDIQPPTKTGKKKRSRPKQSKAKNMLDRLHDFKAEVLAFLAHSRILFVTEKYSRTWITPKSKIQDRISTTSSETCFVFHLVHDHVLLEYENAFYYVSVLQQL